MAVGVGRLFGLHLLQVETAPGQLKPADTLENWAGAKAWVGKQTESSELPGICVPEGSQVPGCLAGLGQVI